MTKQTGFTLLELLISMTLLGIIVMLLASSLRVAATSWGRAQTHSERAEEQRLVERFIAREVSQARTIRMGEKSTQRFVFDGEEKSIQFASVLPGHRSIGGVYAVTLGAREEGQGNNLVYAYELARSAAQKQENSRLLTESKVLLKGLEKIRFQFYGSLDRKSSLRWHDRWPKKNHMPKLVRLRLTKPEQPPTQLDIPMHLALSDVLSRGRGLPQQGIDQGVYD